MPQLSNPVKCPYCAIYFSRLKEEYVHEKNRYWHKACKEAEEKALAAEQELLNYIQKLLKKKIDAKINQQIGKYIEEYKYTPQGILYALYYFFEIKGNSIAKANGGIGIVPFVYEEAKQYYLEKKKVKNTVENIVVITGARKIKIKNPTQKDKYKTEKFIDITNL